YAWNGTSWSQVATTGPGSRFYHSLSYDSARSVAVVFGGQGGSCPNTYCGDTWEWNGSGWSQRATGGPARFGHGAVFDVARNQTVLYGGMYWAATQMGSIESSDTYFWNGVSWTKKSLGGPPAPP